MSVSYTHLVAEKSGKVIGNLLAYTAADEVEIARISVLKEERKQGSGKLLLDTLKQTGQEQKAEKILLDVRRSNAAARAFYEKYGFKEDGIRPDFYEEPSEDAILMSFEITRGS